MITAAAGLRSAAVPVSTAETAADDPNAAADLDAKSPLDKGG